MGLLDDAIREHLDLKRSRGADPAEIERAEREALGPVRREPASLGSAAIADEHVDVGLVDQGREQPAEPDRPQKRRGLLLRRSRGDAEAAPAAIPEPAQDELHNHEFESDLMPPAPDSAAAPVPAAQPSPPGDEPAAARAPEADSDDSLPPAAQPAPEPPRLRIESPSTPSAPPDRVADAPPPVAAPTPPEPVGDEGFAETAEYDVEESFESEPPAPDVLEETPDFLQDTPDHDRLWFEQRPPRDFDFDG
jgi:hypothetical protein